MKFRRISGLAKWLAKILIIAVVYFVTARLSLLLAFEHTKRLRYGCRRELMWNA